MQKYTSRSLLRATRPWNTRPWTTARFAVTRAFPTTDLGLKHIGGPALEFAVDLIAVHGLGAHPRRTWCWQPPSVDTTPEAGGEDAGSSTVEVNWLESLLPGALPSVRINTFNYVSDWEADAPHETLRNLALKLLSNISAATSREDGQQAPRPLVFLGHSFGGLVIEKALVLAAQIDKYRHLLHQTQSVFLLGTPHRGTKAADLGVTLGNCAAALGLGANTELLESLREDAMNIKDLVTDFTILAREQEIDVVCFYELYNTKISLWKGMGWKLSAAMLVDQDSGTLPGWRAIGLHADHSGLNKYRSEDDSNFQLVLAKIRDRVLQSQSKLLKKIAMKGQIEDQRKLFFVVPHISNDSFIASPTVNDRILRLLGTDRVNKDEQCRIALYGLSGSGTTQTAIHLAYSNRSNRHVFWVNGSSFASLEHTLTTVAMQIRGLSNQDESLSCKDEIFATKDWLESEASGKWLMVVDGVDKPSDELLRQFEKYLPARRGIILFTSCSARIANFVSSAERTIELGPMAFEEATGLFQKMSGTESTEPEKLKKLMEHLNYLPLAISQAASYIHARHMSVDAYLQIFQRASDQVRSAMMDSASTRYGDSSVMPRSVMTTWNMALNQIEQQSLRAMNLLRFLSFLGPNVPLRILRSDRMIALGLSDDLAFYDAMGLLASYRLVIPSHSNNYDESSYRLHSLVALRTRVSMGEERRDIVRLALEVVESMFPYPHGPRTDEIAISGLVQHATSALAHSSDRPDLENLRNALKYKLDHFRLYNEERTSRDEYI